jgi:putative glutamine amidotransferase
MSPIENMKTRPSVIGITRCSRIDDYVTSIERAGGRTRILETGESPRKVIAEIDGLLLTGGGDIDPVFYGEDRHETVEDAEPGRDEFEIDLARRAMTSDLPLLAICRGAQVLNVAAGGSLVQDIPSSMATPLPHSVIVPRDAHAHDVSIASGSRLQRALGSAAAGQPCRVNSRHHQSVARLGAGMVATATAPDGVIEAIEKPDAQFCLGVQWHPENFCRTGEFSPLFESFVAASMARLRVRLNPATG